MVPTLDVGQRVLTNRLAGHPSVGDVVVFHPPTAPTPATPMCGNPNQGAGHSAGVRQADAAGVQPDVHQARGRWPRRHDLDRRTATCIRNGVREKDSYIDPVRQRQLLCNFRTPIKIPPGDYFMMGDNRGESDDSRFWGPVPDKWVIGVAFFTYWPPDRIGFL